MSTALATIDTGGYLALQQGGEVMEAMAANLGEGASLKESDLTRVSTPSGGGTTWVVPSIAGDEEVKELEGILVYNCPRGLLWKGEEPEEGSLPALVTDDLKYGRIVANENSIPPEMMAEFDRCRDEQGRIVWKDLSYTQFGSGKGGNGKAAKEQRVLYLLREQDTLPIVVPIGPGSLKDWGRFIVELTKAGIPFYRAVVGLSLTREKSSGGINYSKVAPRLIGTLEPEHGESIFSNLTPTARAAAATAFSS